MWRITNSMKIDYLLCAKGKEIRTSGQYVPRPRDIVQISGTEGADGLYQVYEIVNWVHKSGEFQGKDLAEAELPRVMLVSLEERLDQL